MIANIGKNTTKTVVVSGGSAPTLEEIETTWEKIEFDKENVADGAGQEISHDPFDHTNFQMACVSVLNDEPYGIFVAPMFDDGEGGYAARLICPVVNDSGDSDIIEIVAIESGNIIISGWGLFDLSTSETIRPYIYIKPQ